MSQRRWGWRRQGLYVRGPPRMTTPLRILALPMQSSRGTGVHAIFPIPLFLLASTGGCFSSPGLRHPSRCLDGNVSSRRPSHIFATFFPSLSLFLHPLSPVSAVSRFLISISGGKFPNASSTVAPSPSPVLFTQHTPLHRLTAASLSPLRNDTTTGDTRRDPRRRQRLLPSIPPLHPRCPTLHHTPFRSRTPHPPPLHLSLGFSGFIPG